MKAKHLILAFAALAIINSQSSAVFAQGSLTPPGAPAPTFKTLSQIEPRTAITNATSVTISAPGSYYLTTNITVTTANAIIITTNNVTLDLNGFTVSSTAPSATGTGIRLVLANADIAILNGHIKGGVTNNAGVYNCSGFANGIFYSGPIPSNVRVAGVSVSGCLTYGIYLDIYNSTVVESCTVQTVGSSGIVAGSVSHSTAYQCGNDAISANIASDCYGYGTGSAAGVSATTANNCLGFSTGSGTGVNALTANNCHGEGAGSSSGVSATTANNCSGSSFNGTGLSADIATGCSGISSGSGYGLYATYTANNCYGRSFSSTGLYANSANNCYGESYSGVGVYASTANNCYGYSSSYYGLNATSIAIGCVGYSATGTGLYAYIANSCSGYPFAATYKYNCQPPNTVPY